MDKIAKYFQFSKYKTDFKTEVLAGVSTFMALAYIFVVNPTILNEGGFNKSAVLFATVVTSFLATFIMGLWAKKPFAVAPGMEMNAYVAFFVILGLGYSWQQALGAVFYSGIIFLILTLTNLRTKIIKAIPEKMKSGLALSVGVFLMLIALRLVNILIYEGVAISQLGSIFSKEAFVFYFGLIAVLLLRRLKIKGAVLLSIILATFFAWLIGIANTISPIVISSEMFSGILKLDPTILFDPRIWGVILILFLIDFYGSVAKFIGLTRNTTIVDKKGNFPNMKEALSVDGGATMLGSTLGTTSLTTFVESGVGIAEGGRTGLTAIVCALLMLLFIPLAPIVNLVPVIATTGALFWVGIKLFPSWLELKEYNWLDIITVVGMIVITIFTFAIDRALLFGFLIYIMGLLVTKQIRSIDKYLLLSTMLLIIGFVLSL